MFNMIRRDRQKTRADDWDDEVSRRHNILMNNIQEQRKQKSELLEPTDYKSDLCSHATPALLSATQTLICILDGVGSQMAASFADPGS